MLHTWKLFPKIHSQCNKKLSMCLAWLHYIISSTQMDMDVTLLDKCYLKWPTRNERESHWPNQESEGTRKRKNKRYVQPGLPGQLYTLDTVEYVGTPPPHKHSPSTNTKTRTKPPPGVPQTIKVFCNCRCLYSQNTMSTVTIHNCVNWRCELILFETPY